MNPFPVIFYSSLSIAVILIALEYRTLQKRQPNLFEHEDGYTSWFVLNVTKLEAKVKQWFITHVKPSLITTGLRILKIAQSGLQSMRTWVKKQTQRLVDMDMRQQRRSDLFRARNL